MLDLDLARKDGAPTRDAATVILLRPSAGTTFEVLCVQRSTKSAFLGGAVVFPGGKVDESDRDPAFGRRASAPRPSPFAGEEAEARAFAVAACREALEEATVLYVKDAVVDHEALVALRGRLARKETSLLATLEERGWTLDLEALLPFARWITPVAESRRFDTRFYLAVAPPGQRGAHDQHETTASFWACPSEVLRRFDAGEIQLAPPTHRSLEILASARDLDAALALARAANLEPICPRLVRHADGRGETLALTLPGDPEHPVGERRVPGSSRFVLRGERWLPEEPAEVQRP